MSGVKLYGNNNYRGLLQVSIKEIVMPVLTDTHKGLTVKIILSSICMSLTTVVLGPTCASYAARETTSNSSN